MPRALETLFPNSLDTSLNLEAWLSSLLHTGEHCEAILGGAETEVHKSTWKVTTIPTG